MYLGVLTADIFALASVVFLPVVYLIVVGESVFDVENRTGDFEIAWDEFIEGRADVIIVMLCAWPANRKRIVMNYTGSRWTHNIH